MDLGAPSDTETVPEFLARLAGRTPTPAGGSVAALCIAQAAALVAMVGRFCDEAELVDQAEQLSSRAWELTSEDEAAFGKVAAAWALNHGTAAEKQARRSAIDAALLQAATPQAEVVECAVEVLVLSDHLRPAARAGLLSDLRAARDVARAGAAIARRNVESNLSDLPDSEQRARLLHRMGITSKKV